MAGQVLVFGFKWIACVTMYDSLVLHVPNFNWLHVWVKLPQYPSLDYLYTTLTML